MVYSTRFTRSLYSVIPTRLIYGLLCLTDIVILSYKQHNQEYISESQKRSTCKNYSFIGAISIGGNVIW